MADNDSSVVIVPSGHIGKCEHYSEDHFVGHIESEDFNTQMIDNFRLTRKEISACATCFNYPNCIWLKLCEDHPNCYQEERDYQHGKVCRSILRAYHKYNDKQKDEVQD